MDVREKLVELIGSTEYGNGSLVGKNFQKGFIEKIASNLIDHGVTVQEWTPVTERLPGTEKVLITDGEIVMRGYRRPDGVWKTGVNHNDLWGRFSLYPPTHWMPLPEPPKEGE